MIHLECETKIPFLWGNSVFKKKNWSQINLIVGPNGSGKTILSQLIANHFQNAGYNVVFIRSDRNKENRQNQLEILRNNEHVRIKIEKVLSSMFGKSIKFIEDADGSLIPIVKNKTLNLEYMLDDSECHGLKEIISLLVYLYSGSSDDKVSCGEVMFFDEPELHLHPQFQTFFMNEIRKVTKQSSRKIFFLISHSPFFIDLREPNDLIGVVVCHVNNVPTTIDELSPKDFDLFSKFLPRFNTYHKQFFFSDNQIFVEGYTDQQIFSNLITYINDEYSATGTGIIDVGGKDELGVFCKVCSLLGTDGRIITDLDSLFSGKLRDVFCQDKRSQNWLSNQNEKNKLLYEEIFTKKELLQQITLERLILKLEKYLTEIGKSVLLLKNNLSKNLEIFSEKLKSLKEKYENAENIDTYKTVVFQGIFLLQNELETFLPKKEKLMINYVKLLSPIIFDAIEASRVYILQKGCIEHYYTQSKILYMPVSAKDRLFHLENKFIQSSHRKTIRKNYAELINILEKACTRSS